MAMRVRQSGIAVAMAALALLAGCGDGGDAPGGVSAREAAALNEAAGALDVNASEPAEPVGDAPAPPAS